LAPPRCRSSARRQPAAARPPSARSSVVDGPFGSAGASPLRNSARTGRVDSRPSGPKARESCREHSSPAGARLARWFLNNRASHQVRGPINRCRKILPARARFAIQGRSRARARLKEYTPFPWAFARGFAAVSPSARWRAGPCPTLLQRAATSRRVLLASPGSEGVARFSTKTRRVLVREHALVPRARSCRSRTGPLLSCAPDAVVARELAW